MAAANIGKKVFDWAKIAAALPPSARAEFNVLRSQYLSVQNDLGNTSEKPAPIDWAKYSEAAADPQFVSDLKTMYEGLSFPYPADTDSSAIAQATDNLKTESVAAIAAADAKIAELDAALKQIHSEKSLDAVSAEEYLEEHPEWKKKFKKENENYDYM